MQSNDQQSWPIHTFNVDDGEESDNDGDVDEDVYFNVDDVVDSERWGQLD